MEMLNDTVTGHAIMSRVMSCCQMVMARHVTRHVSCCNYPLVDSISCGFAGRLTGKN